MNAITGQSQAAATPIPKTGFRMDRHDRITIEGKAYRFGRKVGDNVELAPADGPGLTEQFEITTLGRLSSMGRVKHEVGYYLPEACKQEAVIRDVDFRVSDLPKTARARFLGRYAQVMAVEELIASGVMRNKKEDIEAHREEIAALAPPYLDETATEHSMINHALKTGDAPSGMRLRKRKGGKSIAAVELYASDSLRKFVTKYRRHGPEALADGFAKSGNRSRVFSGEELALMMDLIKASYLTTEQKTKKHTVQDVQIGFEKENAARIERGLAALRMPGKAAINSEINKLDYLRVLIARVGQERAIKTLRPVGKGLEVSRPGERVEIDECCIDLLSILHSAQLHSVFGPEFMEAAGLDDETARWWVTLAIDCRTKVILGMKLTRNPSTSAARDCLAMVMSDKGQWADAVGALTPWSQAVVPELLAADNGPAFKSELCTSTCIDLGVSVTRTIAGAPGMRGTVERIFHTAGLDLMPRLRGRTFSNPKEGEGYPAEERACLDADDVSHALVRWVVDIYHNTPHAGLGGRTPLAQWEEDMESGNYPLRALPDTRSKRLAFGERLTRTLSNTGVVVMGIRYHSHDLAALLAHRGAQKVDLRWNPADLGAVEAFIGGQWREVPAIHERFRGMCLDVWLGSRRALRARSAGRKVWDKNTVFSAIDEIEALAAHKTAAFGLINRAISDKEIRHLEQSLFASFEIGTGETLRADGTEPGREIAPREPDVDQPPRAQAPPAAPAARTPSPDRSTPRDAASGAADRTRKKDR